MRLNFHFSRAHRDLGDRGRIAAVAHELAMPRSTPRAAACPSRLSAAALSTARCFGCLASRAANSSGSRPAARATSLHEALDVDAVLVGVDAAPRADRHVRMRMAYSISRFGTV